MAPGVFHPATGILCGREGGPMTDHASPADRTPPAHPWDGYLIGPENALAQAGAMALARGETAGVSPLVVHGPSGSGKSRLLAGLVAERLLRRPESAVAHLEAEAFAAACAGGFGSGRGLGGGPRPVPAARPVRARRRPRPGADSLGDGGTVAHARRPRRGGRGGGRRGPDRARAMVGLADPAGQSPGRRALGPDRAAFARIAASLLA